MPHAATDIINLLDQLNLPQINLLGYSMGGRLALYLAIHYPHRINTLILESSSPGLPTPTEQTAR
ncbi:MAG TPA: alpha/beta fold hydrolase, partial [Anaerolineae bacterium]|nr:alpha/beta fold hydrolase [Anaerolineae bacterium]